MHILLDNSIIGCDTEVRYHRPIYNDMAVSMAFHIHQDGAAGIVVRFFIASKVWAASSIEV